jgi:hypothetical protein
MTKNDARRHGVRWQGAAATALSPARDVHEQMNTLARTRAVLKPPHSKRWRDFQTQANRAKRLECGAFTAALVRTGRSRTDESLCPHKSGVALRLPPQSKTRWRVLRECRQRIKRLDARQPTTAFTITLYPQQIAEKGKLLDKR